ncbi:YigZ family protein [Methanobrevibacter sp.]|uniref:YigZ family protein n=1 Tax=Methanobrevibacter sp. TaxID=66852 RepID=UPI00388F44B9
MNDTMKTIAKPFQTSIDIKKSQFICRLFPAQNEKEAKEIIKEISEEYKDATHNCTAYVVSDGEGFDDDGEPGGTAGRPMLNVLKKNEMENIVAIVTRYFGGIKLGAGGLVRAYSKSVLETLSVAEIVDMELYEIFRFTFEYQDIKTIDSELRSKRLAIVEKQYEAQVIYFVASKNVDMVNNIQEKLANSVKIEHLGSRFLEKLD